MPSDVAKALAQALEAGNFDTARPLVMEYGKSVQVEMLCAASAAECAQIFHAARETFERFLLLSRAMRAHISARLQLLAGESLYRPPVPEQHTWRLEG